MGALLDSSELDLFDMVAQERTMLFGDLVNFYGIDRTIAKKDPLYGEYKDRTPLGPFGLNAWVKYPQISPSYADEGFQLNWDAAVGIARKDFDDNSCPYPGEGDIVELWRTPYHDFHSKGPQGLFFDVIKVEHKGHLNDTASFVYFMLTLRRSSSYTPERKISNGP